MKRMIVGAAVGLLVSVASAEVVFEYNFTDSGVGFNDATYGADRRAALADAGNYVASLFVNYNATIHIDVDGSLTGPNTLAGAGSYYNSPYPGTGFGDKGDVMVKIMGGADPNAGAADGLVLWNFDQPWVLDNDYSGGGFDFHSTAVHELLHAVGFASGILENGNSIFGQTPGNPGVWSPFDEFVADSAGALIDGSFALDGARWDAASVGGAGASGLSFIGANAVAANGGNDVYLYSPETWSDGSSGSHLDDQFYGGTYLMEASTG